MIDARRLHRSFTADQIARYLANVEDGSQTVKEALAGNWDGAEKAEEILGAVLNSAKTGCLPRDDADPDNFREHPLLGHRILEPTTTFRREDVLRWLKDAGQPVPEWLEPLDKAARAATNSHSRQQSDLDHEAAALRQEITELRATVDELKKVVPLHPGHLMGKAIEAQYKHWQEPDKRPKAEGIVSDLRSQYPELSEARARAIEAVACPVER